MMQTYDFLGCPDDSQLRVIVVGDIAAERVKITAHCHNSLNG